MVPIAQARTLSYQLTRGCQGTRVANLKKLGVLGVMRGVSIKDRLRLATCIPPAQKKGLW